VHDPDLLLNFSHLRDTKIVTIVLRDLRVNIMSWVIEEKLMDGNFRVYLGNKDN
tara:strand:- start:387 stop:548 length:162 start_codon:yes stop_codon:yes gene_type:complete